MKNLTLNEIAAELLARDSFVILTHRRPDGDAVGCASALCQGLRKLGKQAFVFANAQFTPRYLPYVQAMLTDSIPADCCLVSVDLPSETLFPLNLPEDCRQVEILVDHHGSNSAYAEKGYVRADAAACGEVIMDLLTLMGVEPDKTIAEAVYLAVSTDTGGFRFANTTEYTFRAAAWCAQHGADIFAINRAVFMTKRVNRLRLESRLVQDMELYYDGRLCICLLPKALMEELALTEDDVDDISGFPRQIEGVEMGAMIREVEGGAGKISLRTAPGVNASAICGILGGGGHPGAAGASVDGGLEAAKTALLAAIEQYGFGAKE